MLYDVQGLAVTTESPVAIAQLNRFIDEALRYGKEAEDAILKAVIADRTLCNCPCLRCRLLSLSGECG
ncbi:hypothetical protein [Kovacikia minuta]|uniref:hypothetical protein n=1 Tax=Kovacikia minuta TaxID=2931930 RepID=UPI0028F429B8|nr:hypothetical protein [Kovacikia minuta]